MPTSLPDPEKVRALLAALLAGNADRLRHTLRVGETCEMVAGRVRTQPATASLAVAAAYIHDVGYASSLRQTGFHPIDGARYLREIGWEALAPYVAHHSQAFLQAERLGLDLRQFPHVRGIVQDRVDYCDVRTGPIGQRMTPDERLAEIVARHRGDSSAAVVPRRRPLVQALTRRVEARCGGDPLAG